MAAGLILVGLLATQARADQTDTGLDGTNRSNIFDNTADGLDESEDPVIGFVVQREAEASDLNNIEVQVHLQGAAPNCDYTIDLVA